MDYSENFKIRCTEDEAISIADNLTIDVIKKTYNCYCSAYLSNKSNERFWKERCALTSVYMLGFLSGSRAIRERKKAAHGNGRPKSDI